jgi:predicted NUDIX family NTP pyrophosphohydrolase
LSKNLLFPVVDETVSHPDNCFYAVSMAKKLSAGLLLFKYADAAREADAICVLIAHMGGPFWVNTDEGGWSIPKGEYGEDEDAFAAAKREFEEELGAKPPEGRYLDLGVLKQPSGKRVHVWAREADLDVAEIASNTFEMEWPPRSGQIQAFPEIDRAAWYDLETARSKLLPGQRAFLDTLVDCLRRAQPFSRRR